MCALRGRALCSRLNAAPRPRAARAPGAGADEVELYFLVDAGLPRVVATLSLDYGAVESLSSSHSNMRVEPPSK